MPIAIRLEDTSVLRQKSVSLKEANILLTDGKFPDKRGGIGMHPSKCLTDLAPGLRIERSTDVLHGCQPSTDFLVTFSW